MADMADFKLCLKKIPQIRNECLKEYKNTIDSLAAKFYDLCEASVPTKSVKKRKRVADIPIPEKIPPPVRVEKNLSPIEKSPPPVSPVPVKSPVSRRNLCTISGSKRSRYSGKEFPDSPPRLPPSKKQRSIGRDSSGDAVLESPQVSSVPPSKKQRSIDIQLPDDLSGRDSSDDAVQESPQVSSVPPSKKQRSVDIQSPGDFSAQFSLDAIQGINTPELHDDVALHDTPGLPDMPPHALCDSPALPDTPPHALCDSPGLRDTPQLHNSPALCLHLESDTDLSETSTATAMKSGPLEAFYDRNLRSAVLRSPVTGLRSSATGCRPKRGANIVSEVKSFIPVKHVDQKKTESKEAQKAKLLKKEEEQARRKEELVEKRRQELQVKKQQREERQRKVAARQAAIKLEMEKKKKTIAEHQNVQDQVKKKREKDVKEKNLKLKMRMEAAEARRRQDEETHKKRQQQLEDEKTMAADLAARRQEVEKEEKLLKKMEKQRLEKQRLEKARRLQQEKAKEAELKRKQEEETQKSALRTESNHTPNQPTPPGEDLQKLVKLLAAGASRVLGTSPLENQQPMPATTVTSHKPTTATSQQLESNKPATTTGIANKFIQGFYTVVNGGKAAPPVSKPVPLPSNAAVVVTRCTHSSGARDTASATPPIVGKHPAGKKKTAGRKTPASRKGTPVAGTSPAVKSTPVNSNLNTTFIKEETTYALTPMDPLTVADNYDIDNLSSEDSTDDEDCPNKDIPMWAKPENLNAAMCHQLEALNKEELDIDCIFPPEQLLQQCNLSKIFKFKRRRFIQRTSSAQWNSPLIKQSSKSSNRLV